MNKPIRIQHPLIKIVNAALLNNETIKLIHHFEFKTHYLKLLIMY